jgi:hypothetical protein
MDGLSRFQFAKTRNGFPYMTGLEQADACDSRRSGFEAFSRVTQIDAAQGENRHRWLRRCSLATRSI